MKISILKPIATVFFVFLFSCTLSICSFIKASNIEDEGHWEEMYQFAKYRSNWHKVICAELNDDGQTFKTRFASCIQFFPKDEYQEFEFKIFLLPPLKQKLHRKLIFNSILQDRIYTGIYWDFLERTLRKYINLSDERQKERVALLPHLAKELKSFEAYAAGDRKSSGDVAYYRDEFFIVEALLEKCQMLAEIYGSRVVGPDQPIDKHSGEKIEKKNLYLQAVIPGSNFTIRSMEFHDDARENSNQSPYFMEQLICYRQVKDSKIGQSFTSAAECLDPEMKVFQTYTLPESGCNLIALLKQAKEQAEAKQKEIKSKPRKTPRKKK